MSSATFLKYTRSALLTLWTIAVPIWSSPSLQEFSPGMPLFWNITMGTDKPFQPITITITQSKDKSYLAYGRTSEFFFEVQCTAADAPMSIDPARARSSLIIAGSAELLFREGARLISDKELGLALDVLKAPCGAFSSFCRIPKPSGFCRLYLDLR